jgi:hypothetical protein
MKTDKTKSLKDFLLVEKPDAPLSTELIDLELILY